MGEVRLSNDSIPVSPLLEATFPLPDGFAPYPIEEEPVVPPPLPGGSDASPPGIKNFYQSLTRRTAMSRKTIGILSLTLICTVCHGEVAVRERFKSPVEFVIHRNASPEWTPQEKASGFVVSSDHWMRPVFDVFVPTRDDIAGTLRCELARNEYESIQLGVHAIEDLGPVTMTVELDLPVKTYRFLSMDRNLTVSTSPGEGQLLLEKKPVKMPYYFFPQAEHKKAVAGETVGFWITVQAPADAKPGVHRGTVTILAGTRATEVQLEVSVRPFVLPRADIAFMMFYDLHGRINKDYRGIEWQKVHLKDMVAHGMNSITIYDDTHILFSREGEFNEPAMVEKFNLMKEVGLLDGTQPVVFLSGWWSDILDKAQEVTDELERLRRKHDWPEILWYGYDEPRAPYDKQIRELTVWTNTGQKFMTCINREKAVKALAPHYAVTAVASFRMSEAVKQAVIDAGSEFWTYECAGHGFQPDFLRAYGGLFSWNAGVKGNMLWAYTHAHWDMRDVYMIEDGKVILHNARYHTFAVPGPLGPMSTVGWEAYREGVDDYRYLQLLSARAADPKADAQVVAEVAEWFKGLREKVRWDHLGGRYSLLQSDIEGFDEVDFYDPYPMMTPLEYDRIRNEAAAFILRLGP